MLTHLYRIVAKSILDIKISFNVFTLYKRRFVQYVSFMRRTLPGRQNLSNTYILVWGEKNHQVQEFASLHALLLRCAWTLIFDAQVKASKFFLVSVYFTLRLIWSLNHRNGAQRIVSSLSKFELLSSSSFSLREYSMGRSL